MEHGGSDRPGRDDVGRDALGPELECPGAHHADQAGLGCRIGGARRQAERGARRDRDDAAEARRAHCRQRRLHERDRAAEVELDERIEVVELHLGKQRSADRAGVVDDGRRREAARDVGSDLGRRVAIGEVDLDRVQARMVGRAGHAVERDHGRSLAEQPIADRATDAGAAAGDERDPLAGAAHAASSTSASTRSGLPLPFSILSGGQIRSAPVGGRRSRLVRHCRP